MFRGKLSCSPGELWQSDSFDWAEAINRNRQLGFPNSYLFRFSVTADVKNYTRRMVNINDPRLGLSRKYLIKGRGVRVRLPG